MEIIIDITELHTAANVEILKFTRAIMRESFLVHSENYTSMLLSTTEDLLSIFVKVIPYDIGESIQRVDENTIRALIRKVEHYISEVLEVDSEMYNAHYLVYSICQKDVFISTYQRLLRAVSRSCKNGILLSVTVAHTYKNVVLTVRDRDV